jgi:hypothetical protein
MCNKTATYAMFVLAATLIAFVNGRSLYAQTASGVGWPGTRIVEEHYVVYEARAETAVDGHIKVTIQSSDALVSFESNYPVRHSNGNYLEWEYAGAVRLFASIKVPSSVTPSATSMLIAGKDIVRLIARGSRPSVYELAAAKASQLVDVTWRHRLYAALPVYNARLYDNYGCDWPFKDWSCTSSGNCCDKHDECYALNNCNALSWLGLGSLDCINCNNAVQECLEGGVANNGQPSQCCAAGNCGQSNGGALGGGGPDNQDVPPDFGGGGSPWGGSIYQTPWGNVGYAGGICTFPDGTQVPC